MRRLLRLCAAACLVLTTLALASHVSAGRQIYVAGSDPLAIPPDFPPADARIWTLQQKGVAAELAARALASAPEAPDTLDLLLRAERLDDAVMVLQRIIDSRPANLESALRFVPALAAQATRNEFRGRAEALGRIIAKARSKLPELPREDAAHAARALLTLESSLTRAPSDGRSQQLRTFVKEWAGTEAALLTEVDVIDAGGVSQRKLDALDAFVLEHPRTAAAAKALYHRGFDLAYNATSLGIEPRGGDPFKRFILVDDLVKELESGRYPRCEWVDKAPELLVGFHAYKPTYGEGSVAKVLAIYEQFVKTHFMLDRRGPTQWGIGYLVTRKMADLYAMIGDGVSGVERMLTEFERDPPNAPAARYLRALFYIQLTAEKPSAQRGAFAPSARATLEALHAQGDAPYQRKALSTLAVLEYEEGQYSRVVQHLTKYVHSYPDSRWAWVAALRLGKAYEAVGDWAAASKAYLEGASQDSSIAPARVLGHAYAARAFEALGRFDTALAQYERALGGWNDDYGPAYALYFTRPVSPDEPYTILKDETEVTKSSVAARIAQLQEALNAPGGALLENARWHFAHGRMDDTVRTVDQLLKQHPQSAIAPDARALSHQARVARALDRGDRYELESLEQEPYDFWVSAARMARAAMLRREGATSNAEALMTKALSDWHVHQATAMRTASPPGLEKDVMEIRNLVFRPRGDGLFAGSRWELNSLAPSPTPFFVVNRDVSVKLSTGEVMRVSVHRPIPEFDNVLFLNAEQLAFFDSMLAKVGGTQKRQPGSVMEVPNQPIGGSLEILKLLQKYFPARPGHWGGWMLETFPIITQIEFANAERTQAGVRVTIGYEGATVILWKKDGVWTYKEMTNRWIT